MTARTDSAIVTGGASGLGAAIALGLGAAGAHVVVADIDRPNADRVADDIVHLGGRATAVTCDVTRDSDCEQAAKIAAQQGTLTAVVLSAAIELRASITETDDDDWHRVLEVNVKGAFLTMRHAIPLMREAGGGAIVALGSTLGAIVAPKYPAYCASKTALVNLCKQAAIEHAPDHIRVNVVAPSACESGLFLKTTESAPDPAAVRARVATSVPMGRLGTARDVCDAVMFLLSPASSYISGTVLPLDGGLAARRS